MLSYFRVGKANRFVRSKRQRAVWATALVMVMYLTWVGITAISARSLASNLDPASLFSENAGPSSFLASAQDLIKDLTWSVEQVERSTWPIRMICKPVSFAPIIGANCDALESLLARFEYDRDAAAGIVDALLLMDALARDMSELGLGALDTDASSKIKLITDLVDESYRNLNSASEIGAEGHAPGTFGVFRSVGSSAYSAESELRAVAKFIESGGAVFIAGLEFVDATADLTGDSESITALANSSFTQLSSTILVVDEKAATFSDLIARFILDIPGYVSNTDVGDRIRRIESDAELGIDLISGLAVPLRIIGESLDSVPNDESLLFKDGLSSMLGSISAREPELLKARQGLQRAIQNLASGGRLVTLLGEVRSQQMLDYLSRHSQIVDVLYIVPLLMHRLIGKDGNKKYLVLGQSSDEIRPAGGFTSSAWTLDFIDSQLSDVSYIPILEFGESEVLDQIAQPPDELKVHMAARAWYLRDAGWSPNFPTVANHAIDINKSAGRADIDGVISFTQWGFVYLIGALGGVETSRGFVSAGSVMTAIEEGTDEVGTEFLQSLFEALLNSLTVAKLRENLVPLSIALTRMVDEKQIMIFSTDKETQQELEKAGWGGTVNSEADDFLGVFDSNIGWNKVDRNVARNVSYSVRIMSDLSVKASLTLVYENHSARPDDCESHLQPPRGQGTYAQLKSGCYWNYLRVYVPLEAELEDITELPAPVSSVAVQSGSLVQGSDTAGEYFDENGKYFGGLLVTPAGTASTVEIKYRLPPGTVSESEDMITYSLFIPVQSGVRGRSLAVSIELPPNTEIVESPAGATVSQSNLIDISVDMRSDFMITVVARKLK